MSWRGHVRPKLMAKGMAMGIAEVVPGVSPEACEAAFAALVS